LQKGTSGDAVHSQALRSHRSHLKVTGAPEHTSFFNCIQFISVIIKSASRATNCAIFDRQ
jgi:hypothetical protein